MLNVFDALLIDDAPDFTDSIHSSSVSGLYERYCRLPLWRGLYVHGISVKTIIIYEIILLVY